MGGDEMVIALGMEDEHQKLKFDDLKSEAGKRIVMANMGPSFLTPEFFEVSNQYTLSDRIQFEAGKIIGYFSQDRGSAIRQRVDSNARVKGLEKTIQGYDSQIQTGLSHIKDITTEITAYEKILLSNEN